MESTATSSKPYSCYSSLLSYGAKGQYSPIIPPFPATVVPGAFKNARPHVSPIEFPKPPPTCGNYVPFETIMRCGERRLR